jgi:unsaturated rhamnogalacturonyl hydrolase
MLQWISLIVVSIIIVIALIDLIPMGLDWINRIHIGRYDDKQKWNQSITTIGVKWLSRTPKIKVTDQTRLVAIDMLQGNYTKHAIQHWQEAALLLGLGEYVKSNDNPTEIKQKIGEYVHSKMDGQGSWARKPEYVDAAILAYAIMKLDFLEVERYRNALDETWHLDMWIREGLSAPSSSPMESVMVKSNALNSP